LIKNLAIILLQRKIQKLFSTWVDKPWTWQSFNCSNIEIWVDADRFNGFYWIQYSKGKLNTKTYKLCVLYFDTGVYKFIKNLSAINFLALTAILMTISDFYWQWLLNIIAHFKLTDVNWCFIGVIIQVCWKTLSFKAKRNTWKVLEDVDYLKEGSWFSVYCLHEKLTIELISRIQLSTATKEYLSEFVKHYRCCIHSPNTLEWAPLSTAARTSLRVTIIVLNMVPYTPANVYFILPKYSSSALFYNCVRCFSSYRLQKRHFPASEQETFYYRSQTSVDKGFFSARFTDRWF